MTSRVAIEVLAQPGAKRGQTWRRTAAPFTAAAILGTPALVAAQSSPPAAVTPLSVPPTDISLQMLQALFGDVVNAAAMLNVSGGSPTPGSNIFGVMFYQFNVCMLLLAGLVVTWGMVTGVLHTAHSGRWLGERISTFWAPLRASIGIGSLMPVFQGYSLVQVAILFMAIQGIGIANLIWSNLINAVAAGTAAFGEAGTPPVASAGAINPVARTILFDLTCQAIANPTFAPYDQVAQYSDPSSTATDRITDVGVQGGAGKEKACGGWEVAQSSGLAGNLGSAFGLDPGETAAIEDDLFQGQLNGLKAMIAQLQGVANQIAANYEDGKIGGPLPTAGQLQQAVQAYQQQMTQAAQKAGQDAVDATNGTPTGVDAGWAAAGAWYWRISMLQEAMQTAAGSVPSASPPEPATIISGPELAPVCGALSEAAAYASQDGASGPAPSCSTATASGGSGGGISGWFEWLWNKIESLFDWAGEVAQASAAWASSTSTMVQWLENAATWQLAGGSGPAGTQDPLAALQALGYAMIQAAWIVPLVLALFLGAVSFGLGTLLFSPIVIAFAAALLSGGIALAVWLPLLPEIMWVLGISSWLLLICEALVAGPLWAVAHVALEGEGWASDRARAGYQLVAALSVRPSLMVFGLLMGMALLRVMVWFEAQMFAPMVQAALAGTGVIGIIAGVVSEAIFVGMVIYTAHKSYSLIWMVPDRVLRWIGGGESLGEHEAESHVHGTVGAATGAAIGAAHGAAQGARVSLPALGQAPALTAQRGLPSKQEQNAASRSSRGTVDGLLEQHEAKQHPV